MVMLVAYMMFFVLQIVLLVLSVRKGTKKLWVSLYCVECISMFIAFCLGVYYNVYPGPNFEGFFETLISFGAVFMYGLILLTSVFIVKRKDIL